MGDVVGDFPHAAHQFADALQHQVEVLGEAVQFVPGAADPKAAVEIARHDGAGGLGHVVDALQHAARHEPAAEHAEQHDESERGAEGVADRRAQVVALLGVAADDEAEASGEIEDPHDRAMLARARIGAAPVIALVLAGPSEDVGRQPAHVADDVLARGRGHEVERGAGLLGAPFHHGDEAAQPARRILLGQPVDLGIDGREDLVIEHPPRVPGDVAEPERGQHREQHEIGERQLERRRAEDLSEAREKAVRRRRCGGRAHEACGSSARIT